MVDLLDGYIQSEKGFLRLRDADPGFALAGVDWTAGDGLDDSAGEAGVAGVCAGGTSRHADISSRFIPIFFCVRIRTGASVGGRRLPIADGSANSRALRRRAALAGLSC